MATPAIETVGLTKRYGDIEALCGLDLEGASGLGLRVLGPNGAGKTTAMRILVGLARPTAGQARVLGFDGPVGRTFATVGMLALMVAFHLVLVLAHSTITSNRVAVLAIPLVLIVGADLVATSMLQAFEVLPWMLGRVGGTYLADGVLVTGWQPLATVGWASVLLAIAMWRLPRLELRPSAAHRRATRSP